MDERPEAQAVTAAETLLVAGRTQEAQRLYRQALDAAPADAHAVVGLVRLLLAQGDLFGAVTVARAGLSHAPHDPRFGVMHADIGLALYRAQLWEDAEPWLARATTAEPWNMAAASAYRRARRPDYLTPEVFDPQLGKHLRRYAAREGDGYIFFVDIVGTCNLRCPTCPVGNSPARPKGFMDIELFERIVSKIRRESPVERPVINLYNWGEPLLHPKFRR